MKLHVANTERTWIITFLSAYKPLAKKSDQKVFTNLQVKLSDSLEVVKLTQAEARALANFLSLVVSHAKKTLDSTEAPSFLDKIFDADSRKVAQQLESLQHTVDCAKRLQEKFNIEERIANASKNTKKSKKANAR